MPNGAGAYRLCVRRSCRERSANLQVAQRNLCRESVMPGRFSVGAPGTSRPAGVLFRSVATAMAHYAPCSVLLARRSPRDNFPRRIVHANDGSPDSLAAARVAGERAAHVGSEVTTVHVGEDDEQVEQVAALIESSGAKVVARNERGVPHRRIAQTAKALGASLIVAGSRGTSGVARARKRERTYRRGAECSVLIVRRRTTDPSWRHLGLARAPGKATPCP